MTLSTAILLAIILALAALSIRRLVKKGLCDCHDEEDGHSHKCSSCSGCSCNKFNLDVNIEKESKV